MLKASQELGEWRAERNTQHIVTAQGATLNLRTQLIQLMQLTPTSYHHHDNDYYYHCHYHYDDDDDYYYYYFYF